MSSQKVLLEDWSDYDNKKKKWEDRFFFACTESWEVDYLVQKLKKVYRYKTDTAIREAIAACCRAIPGNKPRKEFVECVCRRLDN